MAQIKTFVILVFLLQTLDLTSQAKADQRPVFRFSVPEAPQSLDPANLYGTEANHLFFNIYRGLFKYDDVRGVVPENAKECHWKTNLQLVCHLRENFAWSDGSPVLAEDYVRAFRYLIDPRSKARAIKYLFRLKNAKDILAGHLPTDQLGIEATQKFELTFNFEKEDAEFIEKLTAKTLVPWKVKPDLDLAAKHPEQLLSNGPYQIKKLSKDQGVYLIPNPHYPLGNPKRPDVEIYFIDEDSTALNLSDTGRANLLLRLDFSLVPKYRNKKSFFTKKVIRFDYVGFGPEIESNIHFRKALTYALNYAEFQKIVFSPETQGCPGLSANYISKKKCYKYDIPKAKKEWAQIPEEMRRKNWVMKYSQAGGDSVMQMVQWYQNQWKKNLGINIELHPVEQGMYLQELKNAKQDIFRKGVYLDRPSCASALEIFTSDSLDNYIHLKNKKYDELVEKLMTTRDNSLKKKLCSQAIDILMDEYRMIPQGPMIYSMLDDHKFKDFHINSFLQLDLSDLAIADSKNAN